MKGILYVYIFIRNFYFQPFLLIFLLEHLFSDDLEAGSEKFDNRKSKMKMTIPGAYTGVKY